MSTPAAVRAAPASAEECASTLREAAHERRTVRVRGSGTKDYLGELLPTDITIDTARLAGVVDHVPADLTVTAAAGTRLADLQATLGAAGQFLPLDPPHAATCTLGGIVAANSDGFGGLRYGGVRDLLIGSRAALADGTLARSGGRVVKNVAGYDLNKLWVGSLGTLGVLVELTFKVLPIPPSRAVCSASFRYPADAFAAADALVRSSARPAALVVDRHAHAWRLVVAAEGERAPVERTLAETSAAVARHGAGAEPQDDVADPLGELRELPATWTEGALVRAALPLAALAAYAANAATLDGFARCVADAGGGIVRVALGGDDESVVRGADALLLAARAVGGSARVERRAVRLRGRLAAWGGAPPPGLFLMRRVKQAFDPEGVLEPGRSVVG